MIEMGVGDEDKINRRQMMQRHSRTSNPLNDFQPKRPHWIHQNVYSSPTDQKRGMTDPGQTKLFGFELREIAADALSPFCA